MHWRLGLARVLAWLGVISTVLVSLYVWIAPIRSVNIIRGTLMARQWSFSDFSRFGPLPLLIPVVAAAVVLRSVNRRQATMAGSAALVLLAFGIAAAFTINAWYLAGAVLSMSAFVLLARLPAPAGGTRRIPPRRG